MPSTPSEAADCNCSLCRRIGGPWVYFEFGSVKIEGHPEATAEYVWGDKHGVNLGNFDPKLTASVRIRRFDGADTWQFIDD